MVEASIGASENGVTDNSELTYPCWELNQSSTRVPEYFLKENHIERQSFIAEMLLLIMVNYLINGTVTNTE